MFGLKSMDWAKTEFKTTDDVSSINFLFKKSNFSVIKEEYLEIEKYLICTYRNNNSIVVYEINTGNKIKEISIKTQGSISDLCMWLGDIFLNKIYLIAVESGKSNSLKIIDFNEMKEIKSKDISFVKDAISISIMNTVIANSSIYNQKNENSYRESLIVFFMNFP